MPDNKRVSTRSSNNQQLVVGGNKQQAIPHCSMLIFESTSSPLRSKKRENPFDGSCDISNMLQNDKGHHSPSLNNSKLLESKRKKKKLSTTENSPSIIPINHHSRNIASEPSLSTSSPCTSPINLSISPSFKTTTTILPSPPNQSKNQRQTWLTSITTMGNLDSFPIDATNSPHLLCNSKSGETIDMASQLDSTYRLSNSFLEDISSSILYLVTGKRDHERISEELNVIWKQETHPNNCLNAENGLSSNYNYCQNANLLPSLNTLCILQQEKNIRNSYGNNEPSYLLPNIESLDKWHQNAFKKTKVDVAIHSSKFGSEDESHEQNSIRTLPSIASLLERQ